MKSYFCTCKKKYFKKRAFDWDGYRCTRCGKWVKNK